MAAWAGALSVLQARKSAQAAAAAASFRLDLISTLFLGGRSPWLVQGIRSFQPTWIRSGFLILSRLASKIFL